VRVLQTPAPIHVIANRQRGGGTTRAAVPTVPTMPTMPTDRIAGRPGSAADRRPTRRGAPPVRRILADPPVHRLAEQVRVPGVPAVLLDQVEHQPPQVRVPAASSPSAFQRKVVVMTGR
jgi:hypothetical protein